MKKIIFFILILLCKNLKSQVAFYDAQKLKNLKVGSRSLSAPNENILVIPQANEVFEILKYYVSSIDTTNKQIIDNFDNNPFIRFQGQPLGGSPNGKTSFLLPIGNLNVTNFADGLAKFLIERSKEELNVAFFRKFQKFLNYHPEVKILFPGTASIINKIAAYNYTAMLPSLRASFQKDLNVITSSFLKLRETTNYEGYNTDPTITARANRISSFLNKGVEGRSISGAFIAADEIIKGNNAATAITRLAADRICTPNDIFSNSIQFVDLLSQSLRSKDEGRVWITKEQVAELVTDETTLKIYLGLLYAADQKRSLPISFAFSGGSSIDLKTILTKLSTTWSSNSTNFKELFNSVAMAASEVSDNTQTIIAAKKENEQSSILIYANYASSVSNFLKLAIQLLPQNDGIDPHLPNITANIQKFIAFIDAATNACYDIKSQNYGALILHTSLLLAEIPNMPTEIKDGYVKYGTFMASVVEAKNSDEVKAAIEAAVLPVGSSSIKRETCMNISLNAFIGPFAGGEYLPALKDQNKKSAFSYGITAPVGVAFSWGKLGKCQTKRQKKKNIEPGGKSFTIFVPLVDVGSMAAFRAGNDSSKVASEVKLKNIISPGLYFYWGFGKCPISLGIGGQLGPQLREVTATDINVDKNFYVRFGLNLLVDIPFFNFYTKN